MGRPVRYGGEIGGVKERAYYMADIAEAALALMVAENSAAFERRIERVPVGVVFVIAPWNYPYHDGGQHDRPALIAGNAVMLKHPPKRRWSVSGSRARSTRPASRRRVPERLPRSRHHAAI